MPESYDVLVLGAGPAGLGAADRLARGGHSVCVLEREADVGGLAGSFDVAGMRVDYGSHRLHRATPAPVLSRLRELLGDDLQMRLRSGRISMAGAFVGFPPRPMDLVRHLPPALVARLVLDAGTSPLRRARGESFGEVVRATLGRTMGERFYFPYAEKLFGAKPDELHAELARRRIAANGSLDLVRRAFTQDARRDTFLYPRGGFGRICDVLAAAAADRGAVIRTRREATSITILDDRVEVRTANGETYECSRVWSTLPVSVLARLACASAETRAAADALRYRSLVLLYVVVGRAHYTSYDAHYFPELDVPMSRVSEPKNYRDDPDDPPDRTVLCCEIPCEHGDPTWLASPDELAASITEDLVLRGLPAATPVHAEVRHVARAYPVYLQNFDRHMAVVDAWVGGQARVLSLGRHGLFAHDNTHHALAEAHAAADSLRTDGTFDRARWDAALTEFRAHVVED